MKPGCQGKKDEVPSMEEQKRENELYEPKNAKTLDEYIADYKWIWEHCIDASPWGVARETERRMIAELEALLHN